MHIKIDHYHRDISKEGGYIFIGGVSFENEAFSPLKIMFKDKEYSSM